MRVQTLFQQETLHAQRTRRLEGVAARTVTRTVLLADADTVRSRQSEAPCANPPRRPETRPPGTRALPRGPRHWGRGAGGAGTGGGQTCGSEAASGSLHWAAAAQAPVPTPRWGRGRAHTMPAPLSPAVLPSGAALGRACGPGASRGCFGLSWVSVASPHSGRRYLHRLQPLHVFAFYILNLAL